MRAASDHLRGLIRGTRVRRSLDLIIDGCGGLDVDDAGWWNTGGWAYAVPLAFRDALDIRYIERKARGVSMMRWTQGPLIGFAQGDVLHRNDGAGCVQVTRAFAMGLEGIEDESGRLVARRVLPGEVHARRYEVRDGRWAPVAGWSGSQWEFLDALITGEWSRTPGAQPP